VPKQLGIDSKFYLLEIVLPGIIFQKTKHKFTYDKLNLQTLTTKPMRIYEMSKSVSLTFIITEHYQILLLNIPIIFLHLFGNISNFLFVLLLLATDNVSEIL
jgi:hypothetical protein